MSKEMNIRKEIFNPDDIQKWDIYTKKSITPFGDGISQPYKCGLEIIENNTNLTILNYVDNLFTFLVRRKKPQYVNMIPFKIKVSYLDKNSDNFWLKNSNYVGIYDEGVLDLKLKDNNEHSILSLTWIMLHEFRHHIQFNNKNIRSCIFNSNLDYFYNYMKNKGNSENDINHIFHELLPFEVDANIFACEILEIDYPLSKFQITEETFDMLS